VSTEAPFSLKIGSLPIRIAIAGQIQVDFEVTVRNNAGR